MIEELMCFGLTRQEATIYRNLLADGELSGYEVAKLTGISRSNTYNGLAGLVDKGAAYLIEGATTKYTPVNIEEFCNNKLRRMEEVKKSLVEQLPIKRTESQGYITIKGKKHIIDKIENMLKKVEARVYIAVSVEILDLFQETLETLVDQQKKVVILTEPDYQLDGAIIYHTTVSKNQIRFIVDSTRVLTGDIGTEDSTCLYSKNSNLVDVFKQMLQNEITILEMKM